MLRQFRFVCGIIVCLVFAAHAETSHAQWFTPWNPPVRIRQAIDVEFLNDTSELVDVYDHQFLKGTVQPRQRLSFRVWDGDVALFAQRLDSQQWHRLVAHHHQDFIWRLNIPQRVEDRKIPNSSTNRGEQKHEDTRGEIVVPQRAPTTRPPSAPTTGREASGKKEDKRGKLPNSLSEASRESESGRVTVISHELEQDASRDEEKPFYTQSTWCEGIKIQAPAIVQSEALSNAKGWVRRMLANCPQVKQRLVDANATIIIFGRDQELTDLPENQGFATLFIKAGIRGMSRGNLAFVSEENLLYLDNDKHIGEGVLVHELAHVVEHVVLTGKLRDRLELAFATAKYGDLWEGRYASSNSHEYFAELSQMYFGVAQIVKTGGINGDLSLRRHDPDGYQIVNDVFSDSLFEQRTAGTRSNQRHNSKVEYSK